MEPNSPGMQIVQEALQRRAAPTDQVMPPSGTTPTGGPNSPMPGAAPAMPQAGTPPQNNIAPPSGAQDPQKKLTNGTAKQLVNLLGNSTDPETTELSKQLLVKLLQYH